MEIGELMVQRQQYEFDAASRRAFREYLALRVTQLHLANALSVRNAVDRINLRHAHRLVRAGGRLAPGELRRIDETDIRHSHVFGAASRTAPLPARPEEHR